MPSFDAGPYGFYVWGSYAVTLVVVAWLIVDSLLSARRWRRAAEARKSGQARP